MNGTYQRENLALAYQFCAHYNMDDLTYSHLSARAPGGTSFYIYPLGLLFSEVTPEVLLEVTFDGEVIDGQEMSYNRTGYVIHGSLYKARPDVQAIFHLHTTAGIAVSSMTCGLLPISQFSFHFYERLAYHAYNALALDLQEHGAKLAQDLGAYNAMMLRHHGTLTCGATIHEAFFYAYYLEQACKVQCLALNSLQPLVSPSPEICRKAMQDMRSFEADLGYRDWQALTRRFAHARSYRAESL